MTYDRIESIRYAFGIMARCDLCDERMPFHATRRHARVHGYPLGGSFTPTIDGPLIRDTVTNYRPPSPDVVRTSKWA